MRDSSTIDVTRVTILVLALVAAIAGCSRSKYRRYADREAYGAIAERNADPRWNAADYGVEIDPRSRYYDAYNPDCPPMPQDDPAANVF